MVTCYCKEAYFETAIGILEILCCMKGLHSIRIRPQDILCHKAKSKILESEKENKNTAMEAVIAWLKSYFAASVEDIKHLPPICSSVFSKKRDFTVRVWKTLMTKVAFGETLSYGQLATLSGNHSASRAVGTAMKNNSILLIIPCHRVITSNGGTGHYSGGKNVKEWLLRHEKNLL